MTCPQKLTDNGSFSFNRSILIIKFTINQPMHFESLYQEAKWKKLSQQQAEQAQQSQIKQLSSMKKINPHSSFILASKVYQQLSLFDDQELLNIETSIPILHATHILQTIESIQSAKEKLNQGDAQSYRLRDQANFVYCLWKMIDEEEVEARELKEIIYMLHERSITELRKLLSDMYRDEGNVGQFMEAWRVMIQNGKYYKSVDDVKRKNTRRSDKDVQRGGLDCDQALKEKCFNNEFKDIEGCFLKQSVYDSKGRQFNEVDLATMESNYGSRNKENLVMDRQTEKQMIQRLYRNDRYELRVTEKKIQEEKKVRAEMEKCTFFPSTNSKRLRSVSRNQRSRSVNGFEKSVNRMKVGNEKQRIQREKRQYKPAGENYFKLREKKINPPKFLSRKKVESAVLFMIEFDIGRHKIKVKVHESDSDESISRNLCKIYCLKGDYYEQIKLILSKERQAVEAEKVFIE